MKKLKKELTREQGWDCDREQWERVRKLWKEQG